MKIFRQFLICLAVIATLPVCTEVCAQTRTLGELPNLKINDFYQDNELYVWISTDYGLCRYNGSDYVQYSHSASDPATLMSNKVLCTRQDTRDRFWVLTEDGLCRMDRRDGGFENILNDRNLSGMLSVPGKMICYGHTGFVCVDTESASVSIHSTGDRDGVRFATVQKDSLVWAISGDDGSISCYNLDFHMIDHVVPESGSPFLCAAIEGDWLWLGTQKGVRVYDTRKRIFLQDEPRLQSLESLKDESIVLLYPYNGNICICARNMDIHIWSGNNGSLDRNLARRGIFNLSYTSDFSCALYSRDGQIWIGTEDRGYAVYNPDEIEFCKGRTLKRITKGKYFNSMTAAADSIVWMASRYKGLLAASALSSQSLWYKFIDEPELQKLGTTGLSSVFCDRTGNLWLNMNDRLGIAPVHGLELGHVRVLPVNLCANAICEDGRGQVWIAADDGLYCFRSHTLFQTLFRGNEVSDVTCDSSGQVYCCLVGQGVCAVSPQDLQTTPAFREHAFTKELNTLRFHPDGSAWFATRSDGLFILAADQLIHYGPEEDKLSQDVESVVFDPEGNAWLGTSYGLSLIPADRGKIISYSLNESLQVQQFTSRCAVSTGEYVCLGGVSGIALFDSKRLISQVSDRPVEVKISSLVSRERQMDEFLRDGIKSFDQLSRVVVPFKDRNLTIGYEAVEFFHPEAVKFAYRLSGLEKEWHFVDNSRRASWSYLPSGRYTFELIAMNYDGFWNAEPKRLEIVVKPSPFLSWYAILAYILLFVTASFIAMKFAVDRRVQNKKLELTMDALEQEKKMARMKVGFFSNISHELRTSLSLIYGPVKMLETTDPVKQKGLVKLIQGNTNSLLVLIDQLLNISRIENDCLPLKVSEIDIDPLLRRMITAFTPLADEKEISLTLHNEVPSGRLLPIDADKFQKILQNLLSNAIKYTGSCGRVDIVAGLTGDSTLRVSVIDNGIGMQPEEAEVIFERYRRLKAGEMSGKGNGIGLHFVKQLVLLHKGKIDAIVRQEGGMEFRFELPVATDSYGPDEYQEHPADLIDGLMQVEDEQETLVVPDDREDTSRPLVAVIEDNPQLCSYLKSILGEEYRVITASNGKDGLDMILAGMPDIVTTDVMMEGMDGYELCRTIKDNPILSHIPVIILTARVAEEDKLSGYRNKANAYITKPFNPEILLTVIRNNIEEVRKLRKDILSPDAAGDASLSSRMSQHDSKFLQRLNRIIDDHLSEPPVGTSELSEMMQISRSSFFRKMKALTGVSPNEYVIIYKLNKSVEMLREERLTISEIAYSLGFSTPSHFSNTFKNRFGVSPKNFIKK